MDGLNRRARAALVGCALLLTLAACGKDTETAETPESQPERETVANTLAVTASEYTFDVSGEAEGGVVSMELTNEGAEHHEFAFGSLEEGTTIEDVLKAMKQRRQPAGMEDLAGVPLLSPGGSVTMTRALEAGTYVFLCLFPTPDFTPHAAKGMHASFEVAGDAGASPPEPEATIVATDEGFEVPELEAGEHTVEFVNEGTKPHEFVLYGAAEPGATDKDFEKWIGKGQQGEAPLVFPGGLQSIEPGVSITQALSFERGVTYTVEDFENKLSAELTIP